MNIKNSEASKVGLVLGAVWMIIGFSYDKSGIIMLGMIMLVLGLFYRFSKSTK